jgi:plastocyanin
MRMLSLLLAIAALGVVGCGDDDDDNGGSAAPPAATTPVQSGGKVVIHMKGFQFDPVDVTAKVGQTVEWINDDTADHNVVATKGEEFKSDNFGKGGTYEYKLDEAGTIDYVCTLHSNMKATLTDTE